MRKLDFDKLNSLLLDAVLRRVGLDELYAEVGSCIGLPLICFDTSFRLVAYAFERPFYYPHWERIVSQGRADERTILGHKYLSYQEMMYANGRSLLFDSGTCEGYPQACGPVLLGDRLAAYCGIMVEDCTVEDALRANDMLADATAVLLREAEQDAAEPDQIEKLLIKNEVSAEAARQLAAKFEPAYAFITVSAQEPAVSTLEYIRGLLCGEGKRRIGCRVSDKRLYMLQYGMRDCPGFPDIASIAATYGLSCGVSDCFSDLGEISERRAQAILSLTIGAGGLPGRLSTFRDSYALIVEVCAAEFYGPDAVRLRGIEALAAEDSAGDGDFVKTLECYLRSFKRHSAVAEQLGLHRNTVINRIKRIENLLGLDISGGGSLPRLLVGIDMHALADRSAEVEHGRV